MTVSVMWAACVCGYTRADILHKVMLSQTVTPTVVEMGCPGEAPLFIKLNLAVVRAKTLIGLGGGGAAFPSGGSLFTPPALGVWPGQPGVSGGSGSSSHYPPGTGGDSVRSKINWGEWKAIKKFIGQQKVTGVARLYMLLSPVRVDNSGEYATIGRV